MNEPFQKDPAGPIPQKSSTTPVVLIVVLIIGIVVQ
ncbi:MAG: hypothetical protein ACI9HK_001322 [Pirellulaceae bacterium]|jgi:hypothetical protein